MLLNPTFEATRIWRDFSSVTASRPHFWNTCSFPHLLKHATVFLYKKLSLLQNLQYFVKNHIQKRLFAVVSFRLVLCCWQIIEIWTRRFKLFEPIRAHCHEKPLKEFLYNVSLRNILILFYTLGLFRRVILNIRTMEYV